MKTVAKLTIHDAPTMTKRGRNAVAGWLEKQAKFLRRSGPDLSPRFRARYLATAATAMLLLGLLTLPALGQGALNAKISSADPKAPGFLFVTLATGTAVQGSTTNLQFTSATFYGYKAVSATAAPTFNTASAYLGFVDTPGTSGVAAGSPAFHETITSGSYMVLAPIGTKYNLKDIYFLGTTGDKILVVYSQ